MSNAAIWVSCAALLVSIASFGISFFNFKRDTAKLKISAEFFDDSPYGQRFMRVGMVNVGRRPVIVRLIGGSNGDRWSGTYLDHDSGGKRLGEHERYEKIFNRDDMFVSDDFGEDESFNFAEMWVEDSLGVRHPVPNSRELVRRLIG
jgi:hypothetical protein